jgi:hypothetical protein
MISKLKIKNNMILSGNTEYKTIIIPTIDCIPEETLVHLRNLAKKGATIIFEGHIPTDFPGLFEHQRRRDFIAGVKNELMQLPTNINLSTNVLKTLLDMKIYPEEMALNGLLF